MCFYNDDYDWCASINEETDGPADADHNCVDCGLKIAAGEFCRHIFQQEDEECQQCGLREGEQPDPEDVEEGELFCDGPHEFGEIWNGWICGSCLKAREAINAFETKEGCPSDSREPRPGLLQEAFLEHEQGFEYAEACVAMYPELFEHRWIKQLLIGPGETDLACLLTEIDE